ncbi:MAG TPA: hypothetical protein VE621_17725 [Bryobacteraceae bacterium]|nr:hypothetical protein [Bryobacteraceae bacterium]
MADPQSIPTHLLFDPLSTTFRETGFRALPLSRRLNAKMFGPPAMATNWCVPQVYVIGDAFQVWAFQS